MKYISKIIVIVVLFTNFSFAKRINNKNYKWNKISGGWAIYHSNNLHYLYDQRSKAYDFGYSELINNCSLIIHKAYPEANQFKIEFKLFNQKPGNNFMLFFAAKSFKNFYGIRLYGDEKTINKIYLLQSNVKDTTKPRMTKWNFEIKEIYSKPIKLNFNKIYTLNVQLTGKKVKAFIDNKLLLEKELTEKLPEGRFGISHENNLIQVMDVKAFKDNKLVFHDDFSQNSVYSRRFRMIKVKKNRDKKSR